MDMTTTYLGLKLKSPLVPGASPLTADLAMIKRLEDAGAAAIVMHSLFEEQIRRDNHATIYYREMHVDSCAEASSFIPMLEEDLPGPDQYLEEIRRIRQSVGIPVIASINGVTTSGWAEYAALIEQAGADAIELNAYILATDLDLTANQIEQDTLAAVKAVREHVRIPLAVKLSPFYSSLPNFAAKLTHFGVQGLVLFNRFYQPDIDPQTQTVVPRLVLSNSDELLLRLRWIAVLASQMDVDIACSGGVHTHLDVIKAVMAGANITQMVSALLRHGPEYLIRVRSDLERWMDENQFPSIQKMRRSMNVFNSGDLQAYERVNYMRVLQSWTHAHD